MFSGADTTLSTRVLLHPYLSLYSFSYFTLPSSFVLSSGTSIFSYVLHHSLFSTRTSPLSCTLHFHNFSFCNLYSCRSFYPISLRTTEMCHTVFGSWFLRAANITQRQMRYINISKQFSIFSDHNACGIHQHYVISHTTTYTFS